MYAQLLGTVILVAVTLAYAMFDIFNNRNVPNAFAYATVLLGVAFTVLFTGQEMWASLAIAAIITAIGYVTYKIGFLGAGDVFEFLFISLMLPIQPTPLFIPLPQLGFPFILSVFITTGYAAMLITPMYYALKGMRKLGNKAPNMKSTHPLTMLAMLVSYALLMVFIVTIAPFKEFGILLILFAAIPSVIVLLYEGYIYEGMTLRVRPRELEEGDIIATNMMSRAEVEKFKRKYRGFGRLAGKSLIARMRKERARIPVYKNAIPLAIFTLIAVLVSLAIGNIILLVFY